MLAKLYKPLAAFIVASLIMFSPVAVFAADETTGGTDISTCIKQGSGLKLPETADSKCTDLTGGETGGTKKVNDLITVGLNIISVVVAIAAVIMIIVGGFKYVTSGGDTNKTASAKNTILYAIVGLVIVALAQAIVQFVAGKIS